MIEVRVSAEVVPFAGDGRRGSSRNIGTLAAALAVAIGHMLQNSRTVALEQLLPAMEAAVERLLATSNAEPTTLQDLTVRSFATCKLCTVSNPRVTAT